MIQLLVVSLKMKLDVQCEWTLFSDESFSRSVVLIGTMCHNLIASYICWCTAEAYFCQELWISEAWPDASLHKGMLHNTLFCYLIIGNVVLLLSIH